MYPSTVSLRVADGQSITDVLQSAGYTQQELAQNGEALLTWVAAHNSSAVTSFECLTPGSQLVLPKKLGTGSSARVDPSVLSEVTDNADKLEYKVASFRAHSTILKWQAQYGRGATGSSSQKRDEDMLRQADLSANVRERLHFKTAQSVLATYDRAHLTWGLFTAQGADGRITAADLDKVSAKEIYLAYCDLPAVEQRKLKSKLDDDLSRLVDDMAARKVKPLRIDGVEVRNVEAAVADLTEGLEQRLITKQEYKTLLADTESPLGPALVADLEAMQNKDAGLIHSKLATRFAVRLRNALSAIEQAQDQGRGNLADVRKRYPSATISVVGLAHPQSLGKPPGMNAGAGAQPDASCDTLFRVERKDAKGHVTTVYVSNDGWGMLREVVVSEEQIIFTLAPRAGAYTLSGPTSLPGLAAAELEKCRAREQSRQNLLDFAAAVKTDLAAIKERAGSKNTLSDFVTRNYDPSVALARLKANDAEVKSQLGSSRLSAADKGALQMRLLENQLLEGQLANPQSTKAFAAKRELLDKVWASKVAQHPTWKKEQFRQVPGIYVDRQQGMRVDELPLFYTEEKTPTGTRIVLLDMADGSVYQGATWAEAMDEYRLHNALGDGYVALLPPGAKAESVFAAMDAGDRAVDWLEKGSMGLGVAALFAMPCPPASLIMGAGAMIGTLSATAKRHAEANHVERDLDRLGVWLTYLSAVPMALGGAGALARMSQASPKIAAALRNASWITSAAFDVTQLNYTGSQLYRQYRAVEAAPEMSNEEKLVFYRQLFATGGFALIMTVVANRSLLTPSGASSSSTGRGAASRSKSSRTSPQSKNKTSASTAGAKTKSHHVDMSGHDTRVQLSKKIQTRTANVKPCQAHDDLDKLYEQAHKTNAVLRDLTDYIAAFTSGKAKYPPTALKDRARAEVKIKADFGGDASMVTDIARSTVEYSSLPDLYRGLHALEHFEGVEIISIRDRFLHPNANGYRDINLKVKMADGHVVEIQLHHTAFLQAKHIETAIYNQHRAIVAKATAAGRPLNAAERKEVARLEELSKLPYAAAESAMAEGRALTQQELAFLHQQLGLK